MHWSPESAKATFNKVEETLSSNMSCLSIFSEAIVAAVPAPEMTDEVGTASLQQSIVSYVQESYVAHAVSGAHKRLAWRQMVVTVST